MRHPSVGSKRKGRHKEETRSKRYSFFTLGSSMQYLSSFVHQPRAEPTPLPIVIITPSSPTRVPVLLPSSSSFELGDTAVESEPLQFSQAPVFEEDIGEVSMTSFVLPVVDSDIEFDSWTISAPHEIAEPSLSLSESLQKITFEPIYRASHALSAVSDMLYDVPTWDAAEALGVGMPSYFTSTPPKRCRSTGTMLRDIESNYIEATDPLESPTHDAFYQYVDLIPYPDVFDLDMYYGTTIPLRKEKLGRTFENALPLRSDGLLDPPIREKLHSNDCNEKYEMATSSVTLISSPAVYDEHERVNILQSHSTGSLSKNILSSLPQSQEQHRIPPLNSFNFRHITPLKELTNMSFKTSATSSTVYSEKSLATSVRVSSQRQIRSLPASARDQGSRLNQCPQRSQISACLDSDSDGGSMDALHARLKEVCDSSIAKEIWEPVSF